MTIREAIKNENIELDGKRHNFLIGFNGDDETELEASSIEELEELWMSLVDEFETDVDKVDYIDIAYLKYKARVSFFGVWCNGTIDTYGKSVDDAYDAAMEDVGVTLNNAYPDLDVEYSVEIIEED